MERNMENTTETSDLKDKKTNVDSKRGQQQQQSVRRQRHRHRPHRNRQQVSTQAQQSQQSQQRPPQPQLQNDLKQPQSTTADSEVNHKKQKSKRDRQRRNRRQQRKDNEQRMMVEEKAVEAANEEPETFDKDVQLDFNLTELLREAQALEKQVEELQTQLKMDYSNIPSEKQGRATSHIVAEQIAATEDEIGYVRQSLKRIYRRMMSVDPEYAIEAQINEKLWRNIFYISIEEIRQKLRAFDLSKLNPLQQQKLQKLQLTLSDQINRAFDFYHELNQTLKSTYQLKDSKLFGIDVMTLSYEKDVKEASKQQQNRRSRRGKTKPEQQEDKKEKFARFLRSNYIHMGDLARYHAQQYQQQRHPVAKQKSKENWALAKACYQKAIDVYRKDGWPYSQLALVSISNGNAMDVVWYYCMSLAVHYPSALGRDNLQSFYSKIRFDKLASANKNDMNVSEPSTSKVNHNKNDTITDQISLFVESFLHMHKTVMFNETGSMEDFPKMLSVASQLGDALSSIINASTTADVEDRNNSNNTGTLLSIVRITLTRCITILLISIWIAQERAKDQLRSIHRPLIQASQLHMLTFSVQLLVGVLTSFSNLTAVTLEKEDEMKNDNNNMSGTATAEETSGKTTMERKKMVSKLKRLSSKIENTLLPGLSIWFTFIQHNLAVLQQFISSTTIANGSSTGSTSASEIRQPHYQLKKELVKSLEAVLTLVIQNPSFPKKPKEEADKVDDMTLATLPVSEDVILLGLKPLAPFHRTIDFSMLTASPEQQQYSRQEVRWSRIYSAIDTLAKASPSLNVNVQYANGSFMVVEDERVARQQKFMKALATQRLLEQVSSLEKNVDRMKLPRGYTSNHHQQQNRATSEFAEGEQQPDRRKEEADEDTKKPLAKHVYTCVVDLTCFLDALPKVKRWAQYHSPYLIEDNENTIVEVIVPLDVIDELDRHKKGTAHMNMQARESIRYLDQVLAAAKSGVDSRTTASYLRTQKVSEKWGEWSDLKKFWMGEESRSKVVDDLLLSTTDDNDSETEQQDVEPSDTESIESDNSFIVSGRRGRRLNDTDEEDYLEEAYSSEDNGQDESDSDTDSDSVDEEYEYEEVFDDDDDDEEEEEAETPYTFNDVPKKYHPIINCLLYYFDQQKQQQEYPQADKLVLVTNDADLIWWAELFGDPEARRRVNVKTVNEWDAFVSKL